MRRDKSWHLLTPELRNLSRAIHCPHPVDKSGKPLFDSVSGTQIRTANGRIKPKRKPPEEIFGDN